MLFQGIGMPLFFVPLTALALSSVLPREMDSAAGLMNFIRTLSGAFATSMVNTSWESQTRYVRAELVGISDQAGVAGGAMQEAGIGDDQARGMMEWMLQGQSVGKRIFGVRVVHLPSRSSARFRDSVLRNAPFGLIVLLGMMPEGLGQVAFFAGVVAIGGIEAWKVIRDPLGMRLGDVWAQTQVVDGKVVAGIPSAASGGQ